MMQSTQKSGEITAEGFYWHFFEGQWSVVRVERFSDHLLVYWTGDEVDSRLLGLGGEFIGPLTPPSPPLDK
jgi:hypothetical protein